MVKLPLVEDELASCVGCGLCLPHCPTFRVTGEERYSPRGRIAAIRQVHDPVVQGGAPSQLAASFFGSESFRDMMDTCVQCRGCETACPSGVPFGRLMEGARQGLVDAGGYQRWDRRLGYRLLGHHRLLLVGSRVLAVAQRTRLVPSRRLGLPDPLPLRNPPLRVPPPADQAGGVGARTVWLHTGCVMDAWQRPVHQATLNVLAAMGVTVRLAPNTGGGGCCGALATHAGLVDIAREQAKATMAAFEGQDPILVGSAGCGAQLKDLGHLLGGPDAARFAARVFDLNEWVAA
ncbi:MAG: (Fe-S)-binding protein, partial [Acidimicrobiales bacterium]